MPKYELMDTLNNVGIPCGAVQDTCEVLADPHLKARDMIVDLDDPARGEYKVIGCPIKISSNDVNIDPPPLLGEHSAEVLESLLGMGKEELDRLAESGIV